MTARSVGEALTEALAYRQRGELAAAVALCDLVLAAYPDHGEALALRGVLAFELGDLADAEARLSAAVKLRPESAAYHVNLGNVLRAGGRIAAAISCYERALAIEPRAAATLYNLASALRHTGRLSDAAGCYRQALELEPHCAATWNNLGIVLKEQGQPAEAVAAYRRALELEPGPQIYSNLGNALWAGRQDAAAVAAYRAALELDPACVEASYNLHAVLFDPQDLEPAAKALEQALEANANHLKSLFFLGVIRDLQGRAAAAEQLFAAIADKHPEADFFLTSWRYARRIIAEQGAQLLTSTYDVLELALGQARLPGLVLELGVRHGSTIRFIAERCEQPVHGFDAFQGLPEPWGGNPQGLYTTEGVLPEVPDNVRLHVGWFADTLPGFVATHPGPVRLANVDCDIYGSTATALAALAPKIVPGTVLVFDEYLCNPGWQSEEHRAFQEAVERHRWRYRYLALSLFSKQAAVRLL